ncbi:ShlB/FhaC/HecB family hemolysin secretion/activation protein [Herbaspirillum seropedicae]|uniref:ShlB/FhaC/HecB family hemolysin secretion/activation protein n=1 Tax=Herbaspirillum seropedicae TaxID=964 RepID=UPI002866796E|nr:ShlB/FhaC/HecB family hemolysin secretion/activation protein [Herbaspirillum seropedicae]MDR6396298.1 hemolysin activation/secretion protein [Herbaspirillum seropedicae]
MKYVSCSSLRMMPLSAALLLLPYDALAAGPAVPTDAGSLLQELQTAPRTAPAPNQPELKIQSPDASQLPPSAPFLVKEIRIVGNTAFDAATLHALVADQEGKTLTLADLSALAARISNYYQAHGFPLARAIIPAQTISEGVVVIQVVEARYGKIHLNNSSPVDSGLLESILSSLQKDQMVAERSLDRSLLLLSDVPGVGVEAVLKPGEAVGTSDMDVVTTPKAVSIGSMSIDNFGNRYIGRARLSGTASLFNPLHHGDVLSANLVSTGERMSYGRISYDTLLNGQGTHVGGAYSMVHYKLGDSVRALDAHGNALVASLWLKHPLLRSRDANLYGQIQYDTKKLEDRIGATGLRTDRHLDNWVLSLSGNLRDSVLGGGVSAWGMGWTAGRVGYDDAAAEASDALTAQTRGGFSKWNFNFSRLQFLGRRDSLYANFSVQWSDANLDSAEKMSVGGPYSVRAYDIGAISGDTGYLGSIELRHEMGSMAGGTLQVLAFVDSARVNINRRQWTTGQNSVTLSGTGVGMRWSNDALWEASAYVATKIGSANSSLIESSASTRAWLVVSKGF